MKIKRPLIFLTTALLATTGFTLKKNDNSNKNYLNHINKVTNNSNDDDFLISAHRGFSSLEIENTSDSISLASKKDYIDYIEIDAIMTLDNDSNSPKSLITLQLKNSSSLSVGS